MPEIKIRSSKRNRVGTVINPETDGLAHILHAVNNLFCCIRLHADAMQSDPKSKKAGQDLFEVSRELEKQVNKMIVLFTASDRDQSEGRKRNSKTAEFPHEKDATG